MEYGPPGCGKTVIAKAVANEAGANFIHIQVDALTIKRGKGGWIVERLLNQLLAELDGAEQREGVFVIGATNRPEVMDRAFLRPGRLGKLLYVPLPSSDERGLISKALARKKPIDDSMDLCVLGRTEACENLSSADLAALFSHFETALTKISPSVSDAQKQYYQRLAETFKAA
ncbi:hypothetical protein K1719_018396 [Acacia pycnantha]|nr:hypothetical protein K1719_018396 [Acacia pycnantha]